MGNTRIGGGYNFGDVGAHLDPRSREVDAPQTIEQQLGWRRAKIAWYDVEIKKLQDQRDLLAKECEPLEAQLPKPEPVIEEKVVPVKKNATNITNSKATGG